MSINDKIKTSNLLIIALTSLLLSACAGNASNMSKDYVVNQPSSIALGETSTPVSMQALGPDLTDPSTFIGPVSQGGESSPPGENNYVPPTQQPAVPPVPSAFPTTLPTIPSQPTGVVQPTAIPSPTRVPTEAPVQPVTTYQNYVVKNGDTLTAIAATTGVPAGTIMQLNGLQNADLISAGQVLRIGVTVQAGRASGDQVIPDSEAVYSPAYANFDVNGFVQKYGGYITRYTENVEGDNLTGAQIVQRVAERFSIGPRVLLTILDMEGGWVTGNPATNTQLNYPMGYVNASWTGLYRQLWFSADKLNEGYYGRVYQSLKTLNLLDGTKLNVSGSVNPGTAALQDLFAYENGYNNWKILLSSGGFTATYQKLFGDPFAHAIEPLVPADLTQPTFRLPWEDGHTWYYVGGPHGGWASGSAWAAVDFAPWENHGTCIPSPEFSVAVAPGRIVQAEHGRVLENLNGTNFQGNGWTLMYMHQAAAGRVAIGTNVQTGDQIGHPSCEGGAAQADHLHFARLYNGQWIAAGDSRIPMVLDGWRVTPGNSEYDGGIIRGNDYIDSCNCTVTGQNSITAVPPQVKSNSTGTAATADNPTASNARTTNQAGLVTGAVTGLSSPAPGTADSPSLDNSSTGQPSTSAGTSSSP